jgi:hypothetical protein
MAPYYGYLPAWNTWITPGMGGAPFDILGDYGLTEGEPVPTWRMLVGVGIGALFTGLLSYAAFRAAGTERALAPALILGGGAAAAGGAGILVARMRTA